MSALRQRSFRNVVFAERLPRFFLVSAGSGTKERQLHVCTVIDRCMQHSVVFGGEIMQNRMCAVGTHAEYKTIKIPIITTKNKIQQANNFLHLTRYLSEAFEQASD